MPKPVTTMTKPTRNHPDELIVIGLVSISDRASQGVYEDKGIPSLQSGWARRLRRRGAPKRG